MTKMRLFDFVIIYLACGAPFGVYQITIRKTVSLADKALAVAAFLFWPGFAVALLVERLRNDDSPQWFSNKERVDAIRVRFERTVFNDLSTASLFEFRETYYRFASLAGLGSNGHSERSSFELFSIAGHSNEALASRCLSRKFAHRTEFHRERARFELECLLTKISQNEIYRDEVFKFVNEINACFEDVSGSIQLDLIPQHLLSVTLKEKDQAFQSAPREIELSVG